MAKLDTYTIEVVSKVSGTEIKETVVVLFEDGDDPVDVIQEARDTYDLLTAKEQTRLGEDEKT